MSSARVTGLLEVYVFITATMCIGQAEMSFGR